MTTLRLKPNSRTIKPLKKLDKSKQEWEFKDTGVMVHESGFSIQFFNDEECEIVNIPKELNFSDIRDLTSKAMIVRKNRYR